MPRPAVGISDFAQDVLQSLLRGTTFLARKDAQCILLDREEELSVSAIACSHFVDNGPGNLNLEEVETKHSHGPWCCLQRGPNCVPRPAVGISAQDVLQSLLRGSIFLTHKDGRCILLDR